MTGLRNTRVLKPHVDAADAAMGAGGSPEAVASAVLTALDDQMRYVVVTDDYLAFGPYASRKAAERAIEKGHLAYRPGTRAMVLPLKHNPTRAEAERCPQPVLL